MKTLALAGCTLALVGTAIAQPTPAAPPPQQTNRFAVSIKMGADVRTYELTIIDRDCGTVKEKTAQSESEVKLCSHPSSSGLAIDIDAFVRGGTTEYRQRAQAIIARKGASFDFGSSGTRVTVKTL